MGNIVTHCVTVKRHQQIDNSSLSQPAPQTEQHELRILNNPIAIALHILSTPSEEQSIGMMAVLSNHVASLTNGEDTENGLKFLVAYLQQSLPYRCPLTGSATLLILREAALPSRTFLTQVSELLELKMLSARMEELTIVLSGQQQLSPQGTHRGINNQDHHYECVDVFNTDADGGVDDGGSNLSQRRDHINIDNVEATNETLVKVHNACVLLISLTTRSCGQNTDFLLDNDVIHFLIVCCHLSTVDINGTFGHIVWSIVLRAILCFEKFAQTRNCKNTICEYFETNSVNIPFQNLESYCDSKEMLQREVGLVSQWLLDNMYTCAGRHYTYLGIDRTNLNAVMSMTDASQYIKVSPIGLEIRSDSDSMESVRCTYEVNKGTFYYEVKLVTCGIMRIGWATKSSQYMNNEGNGIGDDSFSMSYDGCRQIIWYNGIAYIERLLPKWKPGDILGCLLNVPRKFVVFSINGKCTKKMNNIFSQSSSGFYAGASILNNQQCLFNFGREPFMYPPLCQFSTFNCEGSLDSRNKIILPRTIQMAQINQSYEQIDDPCGICFNVSSEVCLEPCNHKGFCKTCISRVQNCPLCRGPIRAIKSDPIYYPSYEGESSNYQSQRWSTIPVLSSARLSLSMF